MKHCLVHFDGYDFFIRYCKQLKVFLTVATALAFKGVLKMVRHDPSDFEIV